MKRSNTLRSCLETQIKAFDWYMYSEAELVENEQAILDSTARSKNIERVYRNSCFDKDGKYNLDRYIILKEAIDHKI